MTGKTDSDAKNPCIRNCEYDDNNICKACYRTKKEIFEWGDYTDEERSMINNWIKENKFKK